jgi:hypothetical protein
MSGPFRFYLRVAFAVAGALFVCIRPGAGWVESAYSNGGYVVWQHAISRVTLPPPFSLGDVV